LTSDEVLELLDTVGAIQKGHFLLSSGRHSDVYFEKFRALERPDVARRLGEAIADRFQNASVDVVLSPAVGGIVIGFATALALGARFIFGERDDGQLKLRRGFEIAQGERILVVEDVVTTGQSVAEVVELASTGELVGVSCILDRSGGEAGSARLESLARVEAASWTPEDCPMCRENAPLNDPGSRRLGSSK
jgi:orotate phosphoribosyltransferase